jgi:hypothetical protein
MFAHLSDLDTLDLTGNVCINKYFALDYSSKATLEDELAKCGAGYALHEQQDKE